MTDTTSNQNGPSLDEIESMVRHRVAAIDAEIAALREQRAAIGVRVKELLAEKEKAERLLPRQRRQAPQPQA